MTAPEYQYVWLLWSSAFLAPWALSIGGIGAFGYHALAGRNLAPMPMPERLAAGHRFHRLALAVPLAAFPLLYLLPWNPIYAGIAALVIGSIGNMACRPDLARNTLPGGALFTGLYAIFMLLLIVSAPGYVKAVWNLTALSGWSLGSIPLEELAFGFGFGMYWAGIYEHFAWQGSRAEPAGPHDGGQRRAA